MANQWELTLAEEKLEDVIDAANAHGPQIITQNGVEIAVVLSYEVYSQMRHGRKRLSDIFRKSSVIGAEPTLTRDHSPLRDDPEL